MIRKIRLTLVLLAFLVDAYSQSCTQKAPPADVKKMQDLVGEWQGEFTDHGKTTSLSILFYEENQELKLKIANVTTPLYVVANASLCSTNKFHFFGRRIDGQSFTYNAWFKKRRACWRL